MDKACDFLGSRASGVSTELEWYLEARVSCGAAVQEQG